jgi:hypothetical protein
MISLILSKIITDKTIQPGRKKIILVSVISNLLVSYRKRIVKENRLLLNKNISIENCISIETFYNETLPLLAQSWLRKKNYQNRNLSNHSYCLKFHLEDNRLDSKDSKPLRRGLERSGTETIYNFATKLCPGCKRTRSVAQFVGSSLCKSCNLRNVKV